LALATSGDTKGIEKERTWNRKDEEKKRKEERQ
jgi:hypothetical protein